MQKQKLDPESLTVETFDTSDYLFVVLHAADSADTYQTTGGPWLCAQVCDSLDRSCTCP
jgi:hypothetical protein